MSNKQLKLSVWVFIFFLLFEGALRKWFLPSLSAPLLLIRDPLAIIILFFTWKRGLLPLNGYITVMLFVGFLALSTAMIFGHGNLAVALYGTRMLLVYFPLMFAIGAVFEMKDVLQLGKFMLWVLLPMTILIALQFYSPQSAWVNRGVGGDIAGAGFSGALGYFRPPGTFSFTTGVAQFYGLCSCFILYFWVSEVKINRLLLFAATISLLVALPLSISRTLLFTVVFAVALTLFAILRNPKYIGKIILAAISVVLVGAILSQLDFFKTGIEAFTARFDNASQYEGGLQGTIFNRYFGGMIETFNNLSRLPFFGYGSGMGTNVGSQLMVGERTFLIAEEEWDRLIGEMGFILGLSVIIIRISFFINLGFSSLSRLKYGTVLPWILLALAATMIPYGQWGQPTTLGFSTLTGGLILACLKKTRITT